MTSTPARQAIGMRREEEQDEQQDDGVNDTGHRGTAAVVDVGHRAGDGARHGDTAEERHDDVGGALCDEFRIGIVAVARDAVGHRGRKQRFDGAEHGDGEGRWQQAADGLQIEGEPGGGRYGGVDAVTVADGLYRIDAAVPFEQVGGDGNEDDGRERPRYLARYLGRQQNDEDAHQADAEGPEVGGVEVLEVDRPFADEVFRDGSVDT